jgi:2-polyprenyl-3-methyl-5-hydroxy-6-metoxy-1,4-benzoquinol methylase
MDAPVGSTAVPIDVDDDGSTLSDRYTTGAYLQANSTWHVEDSAWKARQVISMLKRHQLEPRRICDVGCGAGEVLSQLQNLLDSVTSLVGYERSPQAYSLARARETDRLRFFLGDPAADQAEVFDLLLVLDVVEHVENPFSFLRGLKRHADLAIFHIPLDMTAQAVARNLIMQTCREPFGHLHYFQKETALATLADAGYEVLDWVYTPSSFARLPDPRARLIQTVRRRLFSVAPDFTQRLLGGWSLLALAR